jgi:hypothetical protein
MPRQQTYSMSLKRHDKIILTIVIVAFMLQMLVTLGFTITEGKIVTPIIYFFVIGLVTRSLVRMWVSE